MGLFGRMGNPFRQTWLWVKGRETRAMADGEAFPADVALGEA